MSEKSYAFAVASVRTKENELLQPAFMTQLLDSDYATCVQLLADKGIVPRDTEDPIGGLSDYMDKTWEYLSGITPEISALEFIIVKNDFHNLKAILKSIMTDSEHGEHFITPCVVNPYEIYENVREKHFDLLPEWLSEAAEHGYELLTATMDGQMLDIYLDKESLEAMNLFAKKSECNFASEISELFTMLTDIKVALRLSRGEKSESLLDEAFCKSSLIDTVQLRKATEKGTDEVVELINSLAFKELSDSIEKSRAEFERECDNLIIRKLDDSRYSTFGPEPLIAYYFAKENECKMLRIILSGKHIGLEKEKIEERMRELYV